MKKHKNKIIIAVVIVALLTAAWYFGGNYNKPADNAPPITSGAANDNTSDAPVSPSDTGVAPTVSPEDSTADIPSASPTASPGDAAESPTGSPADASADASAVTGEPADTAEPTEPPPSDTTPETPAPTMDINADTGQDKFLTDPVPSGKPVPVEPQDVTLGDGEFTITLSVRCDTILNNMNLLDKEKHELVPEDGVILTATTVTVYEGESVFNVLQREMKRNRIHMEFMNTPIYNSAYIEGINNLYEFDVGELSGWMYKVNGWFPNYGCSRYQLKAGDVVEWVYTCDLGRDVGEYMGGQRDE